MREDVIILVYVDDTIIFAKKGFTMQNDVVSFNSQYILTNEEDAKFFLKVQVTHHEDRSIEFTLLALGLKDDLNMHDTSMPVKPELPSQRPYQQPLRYCLLIDVHTYLSNTT